MSISQIQSLNGDITNERIDMPYPHVKLLDPSDAIALVLPSLPEGDLPVLCEVNGSVRQLRSVRKSAKILAILIKISRLTYVQSKGIESELMNNTDILEVLA